jgi:uncharacterized protein (TIGR04255 family)
VNLLDHNKHRVRSISDLDLSLLVAGEKITSRVNINYVHEVSSDMAVTIRVTASELLMNPESGVLVDVDVYTKDSFETNMEETVVDWLKRAHDAEKEEFFSLLHDASISALEDK